MNPILDLLKSNARLTADELATLSGRHVDDVKRQLSEFEKDGTILAYRAVLNEDKLNGNKVRAAIELKITPERGGGFDRLAARIANYDEVISCYLMSGGYDLLAIVEGESLQDVAGFVSEKLSTTQGILSTATHFILKTYKEQGLALESATVDSRLPVAP